MNLRRAQTLIQSKMAAIEIEETEKAFLLELIPAVLQLSYTRLCESKLWGTINSSCMECKVEENSRLKHHICMMYEDEEAWDLFYDGAKQLVDSNRVWDLASDVCRLLKFELHPSWKNYVKELYKLPRTTIYLTVLQFELICRSGFQVLEKKTPQCEIMKVLIKGSMNIRQKSEILFKVSSITCPEQFCRQESDREEDLTDFWPNEYVITQFASLKCH